MLPLTVQFIHLFAANLMFKGMTPVPVILRMIYVNTRIEDFFHTTFLDQSKVKQKPIANCSPSFSRVKSQLLSLCNLIGSCDYQLVFFIVSVITCTLVLVQTCNENSTLFHCSSKIC